MKKNLASIVRWTQWRNAELEKAITDWPTEIKDTLSVLGKKINDFIRKRNSTKVIVDGGTTTTNFSSSSAKNVSIGDNPNACKVCGGVLDASNWHQCYTCKARMHGAVICPKRSSIMVEDDKLYCSIGCLENQQ